MKNGFFTALRFGVYLLTGIFFIPFLVKRYGSGEYGLIALAGFLTQYVGMISGCVGSAIARYLNIALNRNDWKEASEIFTTALVSIAGLVLIQLPIYIFFVWKLDWLIDFPLEVASDFRILVICNILIFLISTLTGVLFTPLGAANRLDLGAKIDVVRQILRVVLLVGSIHFLGARLWIIGVVDLGLTLANSVLGFWLYRRFASQLEFRVGLFSRRWIRPVLDMAGWSLVSMLGFSLFVKTDVWMINRFVSKEMSGVYAALLVWPNLVKQVGGMVGGLVAPVFTIDYAKGNLDRMRNTCLISSQILSYAVAYGCGVFVVGSSGLIHLWLGKEFIEYSFWVKLMVGQLAFTISGSIVWHIFVTIGKTKYMGLGNLIPGTVNIILSLLLIHMGYGTLGVLCGTLGAVFLKENLLFPIWISKEVGIPYAKFVAIYLRSGVVLGLVYVSGRFFLPPASDFSIIRLATVALVSIVVILPAVYLMTGRVERSAIYQFIVTRIGSWKVSA
ncbi:lipopolysaccharide biosynthesis protein [Pontiella desulfatans]|nr:hypothetical protein [Pontiella desulfatans]